MKRKRTLWLVVLKTLLGLIVLAFAAMAINGDTTIEITTTTTIDAQASDVWQVFGEEFGEVSQWSENFTASSLDRAISKGAIRTVELKPGSGLSGTVTQEVTEFDRAARALTYEMRSGVPALFRTIANEWTLVEIAPGKTRMSGQATFRLAWWAWPMTPLLRGKMSVSLDGFVGQLKAHLERHPRAPAP
ncbi:MAG: hypothetical protein ACI9OJ_003687 [Myxococcota bacterium]|jgi:hypothetical protein